MQGDYFEQLQIIISQNEDILSRLDSLISLNQSFSLQFLPYWEFLFAIVLPVFLLLLFGWWFFKQFFSRW